MPVDSQKTNPVILPYYTGAMILLGTGILIVCLMTGAGLAQALLIAIGITVLLWGIVFSIIEVRRNAGLIQTERTAEEKEAFRNPACTVIVEPPTGEATPHHEDHPESEGMDQGQLTAHWPVGTPLIERWLTSKKPGKNKMG